MKVTKEHKPRYKISKTNNGITLIALIITIIVMLILVAVTINMAVNGGLFEYAGKAVGEMQNAIDYDQELSKGKIEVDGVWYDSVEDYINGIPTAVHSWTRTGDTFTCSHCNVTYEMGQVVNYTAAGKQSTTISVQKSGLDKYYAKYSKYPNNVAVDEKGTQTIEVQETNWVVLGIEDTDGDGIYETLLITSESPIVITADKKLYFYGAEAYNNGPSEIKRICEELYSNNKYGKARGITVEDVNSALNYTPLGGYYKDSEGWHTTGNLTTKLNELPTWENIKAKGTYTPDGVNTEKALGEYELNGYMYALNNAGTNLINPVDSTTKAVTTVEKNTIFGENSDYSYWLASCGVYADSYANMGPGGVARGHVDSYDGCFDNVGTWSHGGDYLRPVVSLRSKLP